MSLDFLSNWIKSDTGLEGHLPFKFHVGDEGIRHSLVVAASPTTFKVAAAVVGGFASAVAVGIASYSVSKLASFRKPVATATSQKSPHMGKIIFAAKALLTLAGAYCSQRYASQFLSSGQGIRLVKFW